MSNTDSRSDEARAISAIGEELSRLADCLVEMQGLLPDLRDSFALNAMSLAWEVGTSERASALGWHTVARLSYELADAMIAEREKKR